MAHWSRRLTALGACEKAVRWARTQPSYAAAWRTCPNARWMFWLIGAIGFRIGSIRHKKLVMAACLCARQALKHVPDGELRPLRAIEAAEKWARGELGLCAVDDAADAAYTAYAAYTARADAAGAAGADAASAIDASWAAAEAAEAAVEPGAADKVRVFFPEPPALPARRVRRAQ